MGRGLAGGDVAGGDVEGLWRIISMDLWDVDSIDLMEPAFINFETGGGGQLRFIAVEGLIDWRPRVGGGHGRVEFTWEGDDEGDRVSGRGWVEVVGDVLQGHIFFHLGDDSGLRAVREAAPRDGG